MVSSDHRFSSVFYRSVDDGCRRLLDGFLAQTDSETGYYWSNIS